MPKTLLVGEAPPQSRMRDTPDSPPFSGASGRRLSDLLGVDVTKVFDTRNVFSIWPGPGGNGSKFPMGPAKRAAGDFVRKLDPQAMRVILVGSRVAKAFQVYYLPLLKWRTVQFNWSKGSRILVVSRIPHPSGVNQDWNDPVTVERVRIFLTDELRRNYG